MWFLSEERKKEIELIRKAVREAIAEFDSRYWIRKDENREFPLEFVQKLERLEFMGVNIPEEYGGAGRGIVEGDVILEEIAASPCTVVGSNTIHAGFFNNHILVKYGKEEIKQKYLPEIAKGKLRFQVFAVTEAEAGFNTTRISTFARREGDYYIINGRKTFISRVRYSDLGIFAVRTTPYDQVEKKTLGISLFLVDLREAKNKYITLEEIPNNVRRCIDTNVLYIEDLPVPADHLLGVEGRGLYHLLEEANAERALIAGQSVAAGKYVIKKAVEYANQRIVFPPNPIAKYQGIQFPLADAWMRLEAADMLKWKALELLEKGGDPREVGYYANMAKYLSGEAFSLACRHAMWTLGGYGFSVDMDIERFWRVSELSAGPGQISPHMILNYVARHVLGMPRSY